MLTSKLYSNCSFCRAMTLKLSYGWDPVFLACSDTNVIHGSSNPQSKRWGCWTVEAFHTSNIFQQFHERSSHSNRCRTFFSHGLLLSASPSKLTLEGTLHYIFSHEDKTKPILQSYRAATVCSDVLSVVYALLM